MIGDILYGYTEKRRLIPGVQPYGLYPGLDAASVIKHDLHCVLRDEGGHVIYRYHVNIIGSDIVYESRSAAGTAVRSRHIHIDQGDTAIINHPVPVRLIKRMEIKVSLLRYISDILTGETVGIPIPGHPVR